MNKDWVGNSYSVYKNLAASNHCNTERADEDFYATDPNALQLLINKLNTDNIILHKNIWECAVGQGHLSTVLKENNYNVFSSDLIDRGYNNTYIIDFLNDKLNRPFDTFDILTNPPYKYAEDFVYKALDILQDGEYCIMFLKIQFLEGKSRYNLFMNYPPKFVYVHSTRQVCAPNGEFIGENGKKIGSAVCYAWYIWEKGFKGNTTIRWIK